MNKRQLSSLFCAIAIILSAVAQLSSRADTIYVADPFAGEIDKFDTNGVGSVFARTSLSNPGGIAYDKFGNLFVANGGDNTIEKFTPDGKFSIFVADDGSLFSDPQGLAFDTNGNLYVTGSGGDIVEFNTNAQSFVFAADDGSGTILNNPVGLAFDKAGNLFVANSGINTIEKFTPGGTPSTFVADPGNGSVLNSPGYLAFDKAGNLYVAKLGGEIDRFTPAGSLSPVGNALASVGGLAFDGASNLYVASIGAGFNSIIQRFSPTGTGGIIATGASTGIQNPQGLAFDKSGNLSVADSGVNDNIIKMTSNGVFLGVTFASLSNPQGMTVDAAGNLYVANNSASTIEKFDTNGVGTLYTTITAPFGLAFDKSGNLFASSTFGNFIQEFETNGSSITFSTNNLNVPQGLAFDPSGHLYTVNAGTNTIVKFDSSGNGTLFGPQNSYAPDFAFDTNGNLFIPLANIIEKIAPNGTRTPFVSDPGDGSLINNPLGLAFDSGGNLYVANQNNNTITKFGTNGTHSVFASGNFQSLSALAISRPVVASGGSLTLQSISAQHINPGQTLVLTNVAVDTDPGPPTLTFSLLSTTPTNASVGASTGVFTWRPLISQANSTNIITVKATENSAPGASATNTFTVIVNPAASPNITSIDISSSHSVLQVNGITGPDYILQTSADLSSWSSLVTNNSPATPFSVTDTNTLATQRFYRIKLGP
jgi:sugar lactone lactonase YvrE